MLVKAYAKINISLDVIGEREDGYHLLKMIMQNIELYDTINISKIKSGITLTCNRKYVPDDERNLAYKAAQVFLQELNIDEGVQIYIKKNIPVAAGLAGGSTDAAAVLKAMNILFDTGLSEEKLMFMGLKLGSDIPFCIKGGTALCEGIGEVVTPLESFKNHILVLVKPPFGVSTKEVYQNLDISKIYRHPDTDSLIKAIECEDFSYVCRNMKNILENVTLKKHNILKSIKSDFIKMGASGAMMSGSGPTIFGLFDDMLKAQYCFEKLKSQYQEVFISRTI